MKAPKPAFPRKNLPPKPEEFSARMPVAVGKRFEGVRSFLKKQKGVSEELYFYGPKTGWAFRYTRGPQSLCTVTLLGGQPLAVVLMDAATADAVDWKAMGETGQRARKLAHGTPERAWLDLVLDAGGTADFKTLIKAKLKAMPEAAVTGASAAAAVAASGPPPGKR